MYYIKIKGTNNYIEATERKLDIAENLASFLSFKLLNNSEYIGQLQRYITLIEVYNDETRVFDGRVLDIIENMSDEGIISYEIICESILNYFNDTRVGAWDVHPGTAPPNENPDEPITATVYENMTVRKLLEIIINNHNSKVSNSKKIFLGNITIEDTVFCYCRYDTSLAIIQNKLIERHGGYLNVREVAGKYYLDYLKESPQRENIVELGINLKSFQRENNLKSITTRLIAFGKDDITFSSINNGENYVEDTALINKIGMFESVHKWDDVTIPENLLKKAQEKLKEINKENYSISITALDLYLISQDYNEFEVSQNCTISNAVLGVKDKNRIISKNIDLDNPWLSTMILSTHPPSAVNNSTSIKNEIDNTKIEILITDKKLASKVSSGEFSTYKEQTATQISSKVSNTTFETYKEQTASEIKQKVSKGTEFATEMSQNAESVNISINGKLGGKTYSFDGTSFKLGGTDSGNTAEHTNNHSKWSHSDGRYSIATAAGFRCVTPAGTTDYQYITFNTRIAKIRNGYWHTVKLPDQFKNKRINQDFQLFVTCGDIDADAHVVGSRRGALRNIFAQWTEWNAANATLKVRPCLQKIGIDTGSLFGWDNASTSISAGAVPNEGAIDIILFAQM